MAQTFTSSDVVSTTNVFADNQSQRTNENTLRSTFSGPTQPSDPVVGQQWYDTANSKTMQYNGAAWVPVDTNGTTQVDVSNAKGSLTSLTGYLRVAHNDDGTLKSSPATAIDEFKDNALVITYLSPTSFTVPSDLTSIFTANRKVKVYLSTSTAISYVTSSTFSTVTTVTLGSAVLDATVTAVKYSIIQDGMPQDYNLALAESTGYGIVSGCTPSINGLTVTVASGVVHLPDGTREELSASTITLGAADASNPRIDIVYIDSTGTVAKITGTAAASPSAPALPANGISVAHVSVAVNASTGVVNRVPTIAPNLANYGIVNVKDFGAVGDGVTDDTAAIMAAINYMPVTTQKIYTRVEAIIPTSSLIIPAGVYVVNNLHIKKPINLICQGNLIGTVAFGDDNATNSTYHSTISGLSCDNFVIYPACMCRFENIRATYSIRLVGKNNYGLMYNKFSCIATSRLIIDVTDGFVNLNRFANIEAVGDSNNYGIEIIGNKDCHGNIFETIDVSYGKGIKNSSDTQQPNTIIGMYLEGGTDQKIIGNFDVIAPVFPYTGEHTKIRTLWRNNMLNCYGDREGSKLSYTPQNLAIGGCWEYVRDGAMMCVYTSPANLMQIATDSTNPAGISNVLKGTVTEGNIISINLGVIRTGVVNVALLYKGVIKEMQIGDVEGLDQWTEYDDEGISLDDGWKLIRARKTTNKKGKYNLTIMPGSGDFEIGAVASSNAEVIGVPVAPRVCREVTTAHCGDMQIGTTAKDVSIPFSMSYADILDTNYTFVDGGDAMANITKSYIKASNASSLTIHVEYATPCAFNIKLSILGILA